MHRLLNSTRSKIAASLVLVGLIAAPLTAQAVPVKPLLPVATPELPIKPAGISGVPESVPQEGCQPDPLETKQQTLKCRYGPLVVTPGTNLILLGPVTIEQPQANGFMLKMTPNMIDAATGEVPHIHEVHLHHGVWLDAGQGTNSIDVPFMAAGEEKTVSSPPPGFGYKVDVNDEWILNYMIHNQTSASYTTFITYDLEWVNASSPLAASITPVKPIWWDTVGGFYPVYDPTQNESAAKEHVRPDGFGVDEAMELVWMAGHVHPGGKQIEIRKDTCAGSTAGRGEPIFTSVAKTNPREGDQNPFGSWDYLMTATPPDFRYTMHRGDRVQFNTVYDNTHPWYEAMGIVFGWGVPLSTPGYTPTAARCQLVTSSVPGQVTNGLPRPPIWGGDTTLFFEDGYPSVAGQAPVSEIDIAAFDYFPGGTGKAPAPVKAGSNVIVKNLDFGGSIYHSITSCADACNKNTGQVYPLPSWSFDSYQLGYGIEGATAAEGGVYIPFYTSDPQDHLTGDPTKAVIEDTDSYTWDWSIPNVPVGTTIPYFCRVHPFMRGSVQVVE
ncbi:MAG TPA: hypothetical protein VNB24_06720 [Acidimicrobiales bacterium]|nr:hypothetical protein [Acidimicrobiales bacterium]